MINIDAKVTDVIDAITKYELGDFGILKIILLFNVRSIIFDPWPE